MQLNYLGPVLFLWILLKTWQAGPEPQLVQCSLFPITEVRPSTPCPMNHEVFQLDLWEQALFLALCKCQILLPLILPGSSFLGLGNFLYVHVVVGLSLQTFEYFLCETFSSLVFYLHNPASLEFPDCQQQILGSNTVSKTWELPRELDQITFFG